MRLLLLDILKEEIKEQGYGRLYQSLELSPGKKAGDISGYDFETNSTIKKSEPILKEPEVASYNLEDTEISVEESTLRDKIVSDAKTSLGVKYCWGGESLGEGGYDCSGFAYAFYKKNGITIPRTAKDQYTKSEKITEKELKKGDLIFFENTQKSLGDGVASHVGMVNDIQPNGKIDMIHASTSKGIEILTDFLSHGFYKRHFLGYGRLL
jgi:cell wall-associated NlpC family hydrolase